MLTAWSYECSRVYRDRLVTDAEKTTFDGLLRSVLESKFSVELTSNGALSIFIAETVT